MGKAFAAAALGSALAALLAGCMTTTPEPAPAQVAARASITSEMLVGKWGLGSYRKDAERPRTEGQAREACGKPYVISKGPTGGVMMYQPDQSKAQELVVKAGDGGTYIGPADDPAGGQLDRRVVSFDGNVMVTQWIDPDVLTRHGNMVFLRCSAKSWANGLTDLLLLHWRRVSMRRVESFGLAALAICLLALVAPNPSAATTPNVIEAPSAADEMKIDDQPRYEPSAEQEQLDPQYQRQLVFYRTSEPPGTIIIQTSERYLYLVQGGNRAIRYGIGVGRDGFQWQGLVRISRKQEWPDWRPPPEMIERQPYLPRFMAGGPGNPLGARAMYLGATVYRIHGTNQPDTIGHAVSSGCFRLVNDDVIDLYDRVPVGTKVIIRQAVAL